MKFSDSPSFSFSDGGGEMGRIIHNFNWSDTHLGHPDSWPQGLKSTLQTLLYSSFPMFLLWGDELAFFYNDAYKNRMGNESGPPPALGKSGAEALAPVWAAIQPLIEDVWTTGRPVQQENLLLPLSRRGKKENTWWSVSYTPIKESTGIVKGVLALAHETTKEVLFQSSLKEEKEQLEYALDAGELGAWSLDTNTNAFTCNNKTREIFGLPADENIDLDTALNAIVDEDRERVREAITSALTYGSNGYEVEYSVINIKTGEKKIIKARGKAYFTDEAKPFRFSGTLQDVTAERTYRKELEKLKQMIEVSSNCMALATLDGQLQYMNKVGRELFGILPYEDIRHLHVKDLYTAGVYHFVKNTILPTLLSQKRYNGRINIRHLVTGEEIPCYGSYLLVPDPITGEPIARGGNL